MIQQVVEQEKGLPKRCRIHNDGSEEWSYEVMGERYTIPAGGHIDVSRRIGVAVRGFYPGKNVRSKLRMELLPDAGYDEPEALNAQKVRVYACPKCDFECESKEELSKHDSETHKRGPKPKTTEE